MLLSPSCQREKLYIDFFLQLFSNEIRPLFSRHKCNVKQKNTLKCLKTLRTRFVPVSIMGQAKLSVELRYYLWSAWVYQHFYTIFDFCTLSRFGVCMVGLAKTPSVTSLYKFRLGLMSSEPMKSTFFRSERVKRTKHSRRQGMSRDIIWTPAVSY